MKGARARAWLIAASLFAFILLTQDLAYTLSSFLRARGFLWPTIVTVGTVAAAVVGYLLWFGARIRHPLVWLRAAPPLAAFAAAMILLRRSPAERFHFIEYGILALCILRALTYDLRPHSAYLATFVLTALAGLVDELVQDLSPVRYFDWMDVWVNVTAAALATAVFGALFGTRPDRARFTDLPRPLDD